jgi:serine phosphatase RsbU (regulator of sigma subunit)
MSIGLFNEQSTEAEVMTLKRRMNQKEELTKQVVSISSFRSIHALRRNQHFLVDDLREVESPSNHENYIIAEEILSYLVMPLFTEDGLIGFVSISTKQANKIEAEDIDLMRELADVTAATIQKLRYQNIIQQKNTDISASINYARRIQDSILPPENHVKEILGDVFILYRPKDVLSGDYYWLETRDNYSFVAVADSTGHGVPGALLSLMGHNLLNQAIQERHLTSPSDILDYLNTGIQQTLNQYKKEGELRDGMDIVLCVFERNSKRLMYAGAINPLYIVRNDELIQLKGNRFSIGSYYDQKLRPFSLQEFELQEGDLLYLFTDGFADQFGGDSDRKLSHRRFRELLLSLQNMPMHAQREVLNNQLEAWMGGVAQTDDVCVLGIRIQ